MKRVLLTTYPGAYLYRGGGEREIFQLRDALNMSGLIADLYGPGAHPISEYDTVIHFSLAGGSEQMLDHLATNGRQMILWPNLWFVTEPTSETTEHIQTLVNRFSAIVFKSNAELMHFKNYFSIENKVIIIVSPGVAVEFSEAKRTNLFAEVYGLKDYVFWPGIIEPQKNQLAAVKALSGFEISLVIAGSVRDQQYFDLCRDSAGENIIFISEMPFGSEIYISALTGCKVFLEIPLDFPGVSAIEAMHVGCDLILSDCAWSREFFGKNATLVNPHSEIDVRHAVQLQLARPIRNTPVMNTTDCLLPCAFSNLFEYLSKESGV